MLGCSYRGDDITAMIVKWNVNVKDYLRAKEGCRLLILVSASAQGTDSSDNHEFTLIRPELAAGPEAAERTG